MAVVSDEDHFEDCIEHNLEVIANGKKMAEAIGKEGDWLFARRLMARCFAHDLDKYFGSAWTYMRKGADIESIEFKVAVENHNALNAHHPAYHGDIHKMDELDIAEFICDCGARSSLFKSSLQDYLDYEATSRFKFTAEDPIYAKMMKYKQYLCEEPFKHGKKT